MSEPRAASRRPWVAETRIPPIQGDQQSDFWSADFMPRLESSFDTVQPPASSDTDRR
jgi:hypothetical protein